MTRRQRHEKPPKTPVTADPSAAGGADNKMAAAVHGQSKSSLPALGLAALGVVFGDIGTSPLYTLKTVLDLTGGATPATVLGVLSLIVWTLIVITTVKYVTIAMRVDNDGEGGILALMALLGVKRQRRPAIVALGLFGAALIYGDGAITPAISVLSALEGLTLAAPGLGPYVVPTAVAILIALFAIQSRGTASIGRAFGPVMAVWSPPLRCWASGVSRSIPRYCSGSTRATRSPISLTTGSRPFPSWGACSSVSPDRRRCTQTWAISAPRRSGWRGRPSCFRA